MPLYAVNDFLPQVHPSAWVAPSAEIMGQVLVQADASVWFGCVVRGDVERIRIGAGANVQDLSVLHADPGAPLTIGERVTVGHKAMLHGCTIGNRVLIGMGAVILDDAVIADDVIIGAGSLVPPRKHLESGFLYTGSPAKAARELTVQERAFLVQSAANYTATAQAYRETDGGTTD